MKPTLAVLFWFYKDVALCINRLQLLRKYNPSIKIFGLYGGDPAASDEYKVALIPFLDDFYCYCGEHDTRGKWRNGDLVILDWFRNRGTTLPWDTIVIVQWDMLLFKPVHQLFGMVEKNQVLFSGLRPVKEIQSWWLWTRKTNPQELQCYNEFVDHIRVELHYKGEPLACHFIVACLPRIFMEKFNALKRPDIGYLEYKLPTLAKAFSLEFCLKHPYMSWWRGGKKVSKKRWPWHTIVADNIFQIDSATILLNIWNPLGAKLFHPYNGPFPLTWMEWGKKLISIGLKRKIPSMKS